MSRFRLRFLLQEFDLPIGEVVIGRSPDCHITIEDPLISRQHAKILVTPTESTYVDLGSRNGSRINGRVIQGSVVLADADRIRLGAQELVFFEVGPERRAPRQTGAMLFCRGCATPFPEGARVCPHCGAPPTASTREDETMSGLHVEPRRTWMLQLMGEVLERALGTRKVNEAERILQRAVDEFNERIASGDSFEPEQLAKIADYATRVALLKGDAAWVRWVVDVFQQFGCVPPAAVIDRLGEAREIPGVAAIVGEAAARWRASESTLASDQVASLRRLDALTRTVGV